MADVQAAPAVQKPLAVAAAVDAGPVEPGMAQVGVLPQAGSLAALVGGPV